MKYLIYLLILCWNLSIGQTNVIKPNKGIKGISVVLDTTSISDVIKIYGNDYLKSEKTSVTYYQYDKIGLTFQIDPYDKNQIVRSIYIESPFKVKTENGIVLNESTMNDVLELYNEKGCFTSKNYVWRPQKGITFYIKKDPNKKGYNTKEKIYKIEVHNNGEFGIPSRVNFEFNSEPSENKLTELLTILKSDTINFKQLDSFWETEEKTEKEPYGLEKITNFERIIENNLKQENIEIRIVGSSYNLNIVKSGENLIHLKLTEQSKNKILLEKNDKSEINKLSLGDINFDVHTYGTFCGFTGTPPDKCQEMLRLVRENYYKELSKWIKSINPEISTYGYIGLDFLKRKGNNILPTELERMGKLRESDIQLNTCQGCIFGVTEKISDILNKKNLKQSYLAFEKSGWLK